MTDNHEDQDVYTVEQFNNDLRNAPTPINIGKKLNTLLQVDFGTGGATAIINDEDISLRINLLRNILIHNPNHKVAFFTWNKSAFFVYNTLLNSHIVDKNIEIITPSLFEKLRDQASLVKIASLTKTQEQEEYIQRIKNNLDLFDCHPHSFAEISDLITQYIENNKNETSITIFIDDIFIMMELDNISKCKMIFKRFNKVHNWFLNKNNKVHIFLGFGHCDTEKKEDIMNGNMRNVLEYKSRAIFIHKSRHGPTGFYSCSEFSQETI